MIMNKRAQAEVVAGALILIVILAFGVVSSVGIINENRYVGDKDTKIYYDLKKCDISKIPRENIISFKNLDEVTNNGYKPAECSL